MHKNPARAGFLCLYFLLTHKAWYGDSVKARQKKYGIIILGSSLLLLCLLFYSAHACVRVLPQERVMSSHGFKVWFGATLESFVQSGERVCVPNAWEPLGYSEYTFGWARFPEGEGLYVKSIPARTQL